MDYTLQKNPDEEINDDGFSMKRFWNILRQAIEPVMFFYVLALHTQSPLLLQYIKIRYGQQYGLNASSVLGKKGCYGNTSTMIGGEDVHTKIQSEASIYQTRLMLCETIPSIIVCLFLGPLSDRIGRKPILAVSLLSSLVEAGFILATMYGELNVNIILIGSFINGIGGYFTSLQMISMAIIADLTSKESRYLRIGIASAFVMLAGFTSSLLSGVMIKHIGYLKSIWVVTSYYLAALLYCLFILRETHSGREGRNSFIKFLKYPYTALCCLFKPTPKRWKILSIFTAEMFHYMAYRSAIPVYTLFVIGRPFCLSPEYVGFFLATRFACIGVGLVLSLKLLRFLPDYGMALVGLISIAAGFTGFLLAETNTAIFLVLLLMVSAALPESMFRAGLSTNVGKEDQGKIFSLIASMEILFVFLGNYSYNAIYRIGLRRKFPGLAFVFGLSVLTIPIALCIFQGIKEKCCSNDEIDNVIEDETIATHDSDDILN